MLEKMSDFFEKRLSEYDKHMLSEIESATEFYPFTAAQLPMDAGCTVLDLGCGTGLELSEYFKLNPDAKITGIDLSAGMLYALKVKFPDKNINLICDSYFDAPLGENVYDAAISVESLHHFTKEEKIPLYKKLCKALKSGGYFILTDYFASTPEEERLHRENFLALKKSEGIDDGEFYHYDTPLTVQNETEALIKGGFKSVTVLSRWGNTVCLRASV